MKKEKSETDNVYVCYCILREMHPGKHQAERLREVTEALWDAQTFYEKMGALMFGQAFVYGSREGIVRPFTVYEDELAEERMKDNFSYLLRVLLDKIKQKKEVTLAQLNDLYAMKFPDQVLENRDYYAFLVHLSQKEHYDLDMIKDHPDTFLEDTMADFLKANPGYEGLKFRLIYLPDETISILERFEMSNIRFERTEE